MDEVLKLALEDPSKIKLDLSVPDPVKPVESTPVS